MTNLEKKIVAFIREAGDKSKYTPEQQKIYTAFTKTSGSKIYLRVTDKFNVSYKLYMPTGYYLEKIMTKHYQGAKGMVTAFEILNLLDVIRTGDKYRDIDTGHWVYYKRYRRKGATYTAIVKIAKDGINSHLLSFYTNIGYGK